MPATRGTTPLMNTKCSNQLGLVDFRLCSKAWRPSTACKTLICRELASWCLSLALLFQRDVVCRPGEDSSPTSHKHSVPATEADVIVLDLEDSVAEGEKDTARANVVEVACAEMLSQEVQILVLEEPQSVLCECESELVPLHELVPRAGQCFVNVLQLAVLVLSFASSVFGFPSDDHVTIANMFYPSHGSRAPTDNGRRLCTNNSNCSAILRQLLHGQDVIAVLEEGGGRCDMFVIPMAVSYTHLRAHETEADL
eukprot:4302882-Amphidinium_carterae.1